MSDVIMPAARDELKVRLRSDRYACYQHQSIKESRASKIDIRVLSMEHCKLRKGRNMQSVSQAFLGQTIACGNWTFWTCSGGVTCGIGMYMLRSVPLEPMKLEPKETNVSLFSQDA